MSDRFSEDHILIKQDIFNSEIFNIRMGNMEVDVSEEWKSSAPEVRSQAIAAGIERAKQDGYRHLTCRIDTAYKQTANALIQNGFQIADVLVTYCFDFAKCTLTPVTHRCQLGDCRPEDIERLKEIAKHAFKIDRFHSDPTLPNDLCDRYYEKWVENSCHGFADKVLVAYHGGVPVGFSTGKYTEGDEYIHLVLSAVASEARGLGVYTSMEYGLMQWAKELAEKRPHIKGVLLGTQIDNIPVQKTWIKLGFTMYSSRYVFQKAIF